MELKESSTKTYWESGATSPHSSYYYSSSSSSFGCTVLYGHWLLDDAQIFLSTSFLHHASTVSIFKYYKTLSSHLNLDLFFSRELSGGRRLSFCNVSFSPFWLSVLTTLSWLLSLPLAVHNLKSCLMKICFIILLSGSTPRFSKWFVSFRVSD
jgi:hypothetical protein